jgi:hypothetical protein
MGFLALIGILAMLQVPAHIPAWRLFLGGIALGCFTYCDRKAWK